MQPVKNQKNRYGEYEQKGDGHMRFMHIADVHLGAAPDHGYPWAKGRGKELWESFRRCIADANEKKVDLLLIAGDLFHRQPEVKELNEVNYLFSTLEKTVVVLITGEHDFLQPSSPYLNYEWNENVICLFSDQMERVRLPELKTEIFGMSYHRREIAEPVLDGLHANQSDYFQILLAHGGDAVHIPMTKDRLVESGFDYIALGHMHRPQVYIKNLAVYAGSPEPIDSSDVNAHGYIIGDVQRRRVKLSFVETCMRQYKQEEIELTELDTPLSVREKIAAAIQRGGTQHMYRILLTGERHPKFVPDVREYLSCGRVLEVTDRTVPAFHIEELRRRYEGELIGDFIDSFGTGPEGVVQEKALRYGLEALLYPDGKGR